LKVEKKRREKDNAPLEARGEGAQRQEKRKAKRDGNTEFTEIRTQRARRIEQEGFLTSQTPFGMMGLGQQLDLATIPPLRGPTRQKSARRRKSGRSGRDDRYGLDTEKRNPEREWES